MMKNILKRILMRALTLILIGNKSYSQDLFAPGGEVLQNLIKEYHLIWWMIVVILGSFIGRYIFNRDLGSLLAGFAGIILIYVLAFGMGWI